MQVSYILYLRNSLLKLTFFLEVLPTFRRTQELYYSITYSDIEWLKERCTICQLEARNKGKAPIKPIKTRCCLDRFQFDLMDFRTLVDREYHWILQVKDTFSRYI
jgi:hypothetical protein